MQAIRTVKKVRFYFRLFLILVLLITLVILVDYWIRGEMGAAKELFEMAKSQWGRGALFAGGMFYILLLSLPFVPGVELGLLLMCVFGKEGIVLVYLFTVSGLNLAFLMGRCLPKNRIATWLKKLGFSRFSADSSDVIKEMLDHSTFGEKFSKHRIGSIVLKYRYLVLAVLFNLPGNYLLGGGGGISLICGASRSVSWKWFLFTVVFATSPVPILAFFGFIQIEALLGI